jgi:hypothetical protein
MSVLGGACEQKTQPFIIIDERVRILSKKRHFVGLVEFVIVESDALTRRTTELLRLIYMVRAVANDNNYITQLWVCL